MGIKRSLLELAVTTMRLATPTQRAKTPFKIFVLRNNDLGDLVVVTPLFKALREAFPDSQIVVGVCSGSEDILKGNPYISEVVSCNAPWHNHRSPQKSLTQALKYIFTSPEVDRLRARNFDVGIDVLGSAFGAMLLLRLKIPIRLGRKGYAGGHTGATANIQDIYRDPVAKGSLEFAQLLKPDLEIDSTAKPQLFATSQEIEEARRVWEEIEAEGPAGQRVVVAPGAGLADKQWPVERFAELVRIISPDTCGCVLGGKEDRELGDKIAKGVRGWSNRCGRVSIRQSMALISLADVVVCNSSFVMHLASAFDRPAVVILTRALDPRVHRYYWEVEGIHSQLYPSGEEAHVSVSEAVRLTRDLLAANRSRQMDANPMGVPEGP